ncbi:hypothetical protein L1987_23210 [Smallanthus sonchifolius]|uniref:Uncharacterized protein n=1 Tax=Smallanthus sonchifolius TaxID=185202 RepID=A0ACB9IH09_9ASTR|nr:hypothetical protein L1987_23210 [Smallanthus sonchifolius]
MCSSSYIPIAAENEYWTDEAIFMLLFNFKRGTPLPSHVTTDVNPYQHRPSNLPADLWYLCSEVKKDAKCGFWQETGAPCETFSNYDIIGWRTTLQFYEDLARKTDWVMQEYRITEKCDNNIKDLRALCRVFLADENKPPTGHCIAADTDVKIPNNLAPKAVSTTELVGKTMENKTCPTLEQSSDMDCILRGDYFELNDLNDPGSCSSNSANSSCLTMTSEEYFDSMALLQEIENDSKDSSVKFNLSAPSKATEVLIRPATSDSKCSAQETSKDSKSLSVPKSTSKEGKKEGVSRTKRCKMMKYLCFLAF